MRSKYGRWPLKRYGNRATIMRNWKIEVGPFGAYRIRGDIFPGGEKFSAQLFAVSHGYALTGLGRVKIDQDSGSWLGSQ